MKIMNNKLIRLFIAVELPDELKDALNNRCAEMDYQGVKWQKCRQIHLTLNFLGDTDIETFSRLKKELKKITFSAFDLVLSDAGFFPGIKRPSVFYIGIEQNPHLLKLKDDIDNLLQNLGIKDRESREFIPHVTLARIKTRPAQEATEKMLQIADKFKGERFSVNDFALFSSSLTDKGAIHTLEMRFFSS